MEFSQEKKKLRDGGFGIEENWIGWGLAVGWWRELREEEESQESKNLRVFSSRGNIGSGAGDYSSPPIKSGKNGVPQYYTRVCPWAVIFLS